MATTLTLDEALAKALIECTHNFFKTALNVTITTEEWSVLESPLRGDYSGTVQLFDTESEVRNVAIMSISFMDPVIRFVLKNIYGNTVNERNEETVLLLKDGIGEMANIIYSNLKTNLNERGFKFKMSLPVIVEGKDHVIKKEVTKCLRIPFLVDNYEFYVDASISSVDSAAA